MIRYSSEERKAYFCISSMRLKKLRESDAIQFVVDGGARYRRAILWRHDILCKSIILSEMQILCHNVIVASRIIYLATNLACHPRSLSVFRRAVQVHNACK